MGIVMADKLPANDTYVLSLYRPISDWVGPVYEVTAQGLSVRVISSDVELHKDEGCQTLTPISAAPAVGELVVATQLVKGG